jgi:hypothetical protein
MPVWGSSRAGFARVIFAALICAMCGTSLGQQSLNSSAAQSQASDLQGSEHTLTIASGHDWTDTGIALDPGNVLQIEVANATPQQACNSTPNEAQLRIGSAGPKALVAKLAANAQPFPIVDSRSISITESGHLYLAPNNIHSCEPLKVNIHLAPATGTIVKNKLASAAQIFLSGQFGVNNSASPATSGSANASNAGPAEAKATPALSVSSQPLDSQLRNDIDHSPRRVNNQFNNPGDMVNFVIIGSQQQLQTALAAANWQLADTSDADAITKAIEMTRQNKDYVQMPMSLLYLFGRVQDFGYEQAEPFAVVASRHHFRIWKAPFTYKGEPVWLGAGTHDIGFEKDQRNGSVTHKIDPNVDLERQNIGASLQKTDLVQTMHEYLPSDPVQSARNATGGGYNSDGKILVITLK